MVCIPETQFILFQNKKCCQGLYLLTRMDSCRGKIILETKSHVTSDLLSDASLFNSVFPV